MYKGVVLCPIDELEGRGILLISVVRESVPVQGGEMIVLGMVYMNFRRGMIFAYKC